MRKVSLYKAACDIPPTVVREVLYVIIRYLAISMVFTTFGNKPKKFDFVHQTVSRREVCTGWSRDYFCCTTDSLKIPPKPELDCNQSPLQVGQLLISFDK